MPRDPRKHQKALMKKRSKQKAASHHRSSQEASPQSLVRHARSYPILECWISPNWQKNDLALVQILLARKQPDGDICFATYLIDRLCLGLKNTFANAGFSLSRYENEVLHRIFHGIEPQPCSVELAHQMIYASIEYAAQFGFQPQKDFALSQYLLAPRGELEETYPLTFGRNGKPLFVSGPYDNVEHIRQQLDKTAGPGNYEMLIGLGNL